MEERDDGDFDIVRVTEDASGNEVRETQRVVAAADRDYPNGRPLDSDLEMMSRSLREHELTTSDWTQLPDNLTEAKTTEWATYRQALRDIPTHANWPDMAPSQPRREAVEAREATETTPAEDARDAVDAIVGDWPVRPT